MIGSMGTLGYGYGATAPSTGNGRQVKGQGGYIYAQFPDGTIQIMPGSPSGVNTVLKPNSGSAWSAITAEIGPFPSAADGAVSGQANQLLSQFASFLSKPTSEGGPTTGQAAMSVIAQLGPQAASAVQSMVGNKKASLDYLMKQLAKKQGQYATETKPAKKIQLAFEIRGLQQQIAAAQALQSQYVDATTITATPEVTTGRGLSDYLPWIAGGVLLLVVIGGGAAYLTSRPRAASPAPLSNPRKRKKSARRSRRRPLKSNAGPSHMSLKEWEELGADYWWEPDEVPAPTEAEFGKAAVAAYRQGQKRGAEAAEQAAAAPATLKRNGKKRGTFQVEQYDPSTRSWCIVADKLTEPDALRTARHLRSKGHRAHVVSPL
jgi:hypothetical protein